MATCYRHPDRSTGVSCSNCGRPICPDCMTTTPVGMRCPECARERTKVRTARTLTSDPVVTHVLVGINVVLWVVELATGAGGAQGGGSVLDLGALYGPAVAAGEYWRLLTSGFLHSNQLPWGILHIGFNMWILLYLGRMLEPAIGRVKFLALYLTALLCGSLGALVVTPIGLTVGASGAVFGLMGAAVIIMRARGMDPWRSGIGPLIVLNLLLSVRPGISIGGHIGGLIGGALAAYLLEELAARQRSAAVPVAACTAVAVVAVAASIAVVG